VGRIVFGRFPNISHHKYFNAMAGFTQEEAEYMELDKVKGIPKLRSFLLIGSKDGVEFLEVV
jgi:hypothetical protein